MAGVDVTISPNDVGAYELQLSAGVMFRAQILGRLGTMQIIQHSGDSPVYIKANGPVSVRDTQSIIVIPGAWVNIPTNQLGASRMINMISASDAVVSVTR